MCERLRLPGGDIALTLDNQWSKDENGNDWPVVIQDVYSLAFEARVARKREVLDAWPPSFAISSPSRQASCGFWPDLPTVGNNRTPSFRAAFFVAVAQRRPLSWQQSAS